MKRIKRNYRAHRVSYTLLVGPITPGMTLDHGCRNRHCVNPKHLTEMTRGANMLKGTGPSALNAAKTRCPAGHPHGGENLRINRNGSRACRTCDRERAMERGRADGARPISESSEYQTKTHCKRGHELTPENRFPSSRGCKACERERTTTPEYLALRRARYAARR